MYLSITFIIKYRWYDFAFPVFILSSLFFLKHFNPNTKKNNIIDLTKKKKI